MKVKPKYKPKTKEQKIKESIRKKKRYHEILKFDLEYKKKVNVVTRQWQITHPEKYILGRSRQNAKKLNLDFNIDVNDIVIPERCPILNEPLVVGTRYAPSVDRIIPKLGYVKGNVWVISLKANAMKSDASLKEMKLFSKWVYNL